jgi:hypothetical protein
MLFWGPSWAFRRPKALRLENETQNGPCQAISCYNHQNLNSLCLRWSEIGTKQLGLHIKTDWGPKGPLMGLLKAKKSSN